MRAGPTPRQAVHRAASAPRALVCAPADVEFDNFDATSFFDTLGAVRAVRSEAGRAEAHQSIAKARGYTDDQLDAIADLGYHYFQKGGVRLASVLFDGLVAVRPERAYYWLGLGVTSDLQGDKPRAVQCYERARELDPRDPHAEINLAELQLERADHRRALRHLDAAVRKARAARNVVLEEKATAMATLVSGQLRTSGRSSGQRR